MSVPRIQISSVVDQVHAALRVQILSGELPRGARLPQETLAAELGVSRTPLREALRRLAGEGLVMLQPNHGATVADLDFGDMRNAWTARLVIEPAAARLAAGRAGSRSGADAGRDRPPARAAQTRPAAWTPTGSSTWRWSTRLGNPHLTHFAEFLWVARISVAIYTAQAAQAEPARPAGRPSTRRSSTPSRPATASWPSG